MLMLLNVNVNIINAMLLNEESVLASVKRKISKAGEMALSTASNLFLIEFMFRCLIATFLGFQPLTGYF